MFKNQSLIFSVYFLALMIGGVVVSASKYYGLPINELSGLCLSFIGVILILVSKLRNIKEKKIFIFGTATLTRSEKNFYIFGYILFIVGIMMFVFNLS